MSQVGCGMWATAACLCSSTPPPHRSTPADEQQHCRSARAAPGLMNSSTGWHRGHSRWCTGWTAGRSPSWWRPPPPATTRTCAGTLAPPPTARPTSPAAPCPARSEARGARGMRCAARVAPWSPARRRAAHHFLPLLLHPHPTPHPPRTLASSDHAKDEEEAVSGAPPAAGLAEGLGLALGLAWGAGAEKKWASTWSR